MGTFFHPITLIGPTGEAETIEALVDTGASFTTIPRSLLERLGFRPHRTTRLMIATGETVEWPWGWVTTAINGVEEQTPCVFGPDGAPPVIGAITLEIMGLGVDPRGRRLVPREGFLMSTGAESSFLLVSDLRPAGNQTEASAHSAGRRRTKCTWRRRR